MVPQSISAASFVNHSCQFMCLFILSLLGNGSVKYIAPLHIRQQPGKHVPASADIRNARSIAGRECLFFCVSPFSLLGNGSLKTFPRQRIMGGVIFYAVYVVP
jgi:hypothetical protein